METVVFRKRRKPKVGKRVVFVKPEEPTAHPMEQPKEQAKEQAMEQPKEQPTVQPIIVVSKETKSRDSCFLC